MERKVLYHGTKSEFEFPSFDFSRGGEATKDTSCMGGLGVWFTDSHWYASRFAENAGGSTVYAVLVDTGLFDNSWRFDDLERFVEEHGVEAARQMIMDEGYDGVVSYTPFGTEYCAFTAESIGRMWVVDGPLSEEEIEELENC